MKKESGQDQKTERGEGLRRAEHLRDAILQRAQEQDSTPGAIANSLGMSVGHWHRIKKEPLRLGRLTRERVDAIAAFVGWPRVQVIVAVGWLSQAELDEVISPSGAVQHALQRLQHAAVANGLVTPLSRASADHRVLMGRLLIAAESSVTITR